MPPRAGPPALSPCPRHNTVRLDSVDRSYSTRSLPLPCSRRQSCEARLEVFLARPGAPVGAISQMPRTKGRPYTEDMATQIDKSEESRHGDFRLGQKFLLVVRRPDGNRRCAYDRRPQPNPPGRAKPVSQIHCGKSGHCRDVAGDHSLHMAKPPKHLFSRWLDKSVDRTQPHAHSDDAEDNRNNAHRVSGY